MHGNVWEWCRDYYHAHLPGGTDPDLSNQPGVQNGDGSYSGRRPLGVVPGPQDYKVEFNAEAAIMRTS